MSYSQCRLKWVITMMFLPYCVALLCGKPIICRTLKQKHLNRIKPTFILFFTSQQVHLTFVASCVVLQGIWRHSSASSQRDLQVCGDPSRTVSTLILWSTRDEDKLVWNVPIDFIFCQFSWILIMLFPFFSLFSIHVVYCMQMNDALVLCHLS